MATAITTEELRSLLLNSRGCSPVTIIAETVPAMRKTGNPLVGRVTKVSRVNGMIGFAYANSVNNQRLRESDDAALFEALPRKWGERIAGTPVVRHVGKTGVPEFYLELKVERSLGHEYRVDGMPVPDETVECWLPKRVEGARQEVAKPVILRDYALRSIRKITLGGVEYDVA